MALEKDAKDKRSGRLGDNSGSGRPTEGAGTSALTSGWGGEIAKQQQEQNKQVASREQKTAAGKPTQGGSAVSQTYEPGSVPNYPDADALTVAEKIFAPLVPGMGSALGVATIGKMITDETMSPDTLLGGDPGPQQGWARDRGRGASSFNPNDARGGSLDEREIAGKPYSTAVAGMVGDIETPNPYLPSDEFSDVPLKDRKKPYSELTLAQSAALLSQRQF